MMKHILWVGIPFILLSRIILKIHLILLVQPLALPTLIVFPLIHSGQVPHISFRVKSREIVTLFMVLDPSTKEGDSLSNFSDESVDAKNLTSAVRRSNESIGSDSHDLTDVNRMTDKNWIEEVLKT